MKRMESYIPKTLDDEIFFSKILLCTYIYVVFSCSRRFGGFYAVKNRAQTLYSVHPHFLPSWFCSMLESRSVPTL